MHLLGIAALGAALLVPMAPAQASEVVKLARLVITGKRQPSRPPVAPQQGPAERNGDVTTQPQSRANDAELHAMNQRRGAEAALTMAD
ncbi:hypothetical protein CDN99_27290 [Roseateles aquatilis]|uniref:DUF4148 domain-containing protein n=1 Tax=Roseateles aquatilis TaxID=431061 RepID=A0A246ITP2_9BURK|nr:hypothetical protein CDN99_27290 [Roseateles aquatilis]